MTRDSRPAGGRTRPLTRGILLLLAFALTASWVGQARQAYAGEPMTTSSPPAGALVTPTPESVPSPESPPAAPTTIGTAALPERLISSLRTVQATLTQPSGAPARTLIELHYDARLVDGQVVPGSKARLISLLTNEAGTFSFRNIPAGNYVLWLWWGPGFHNVVPSRVTDGPFLAEIVVDEAGNVRGAIPQAFEIKERPGGVLGYPLRTGPGVTVYLGEVDVAQVLGAGVVTLPETGEGSSPRHSLVLWVVASVALFGLVAVLTVRRAHGNG